MVHRIDLNGIWECTMPDQRKFNVEIPGCWDTYVEEKDISQPVNFKKRVKIEKKDYESYFIFFGGVSYYCDIYVNGRKAGFHEGMWDEFRVNITDYIRTGENIIELDIAKPAYNSDDPFPLRSVLSGFIPDVLCTFGGIWDDVYIEICKSFLIQSHYAEGNMDGNAAIYLNLSFLDVIDDSVEVSADIYSPVGEKVSHIGECRLVNNDVQHEIVLKGKIEKPLLWSTEIPNLYTYRLKVTYGEDVQIVKKSFGFREIGIKGTQILLNGKPIYARGILHWGYYDDIIIPNPSKEVIQNEINNIKAYVFNMIKHCLYIPRKEYFELADKNGIMLWVELPLWIPEVSPKLAERIKREYPKILDQIVGHPSVVMISLGCELDAKIDGNLLKELYVMAKSKTHALVRDNSGSGECYNGLAVDYADFFDYHFYADLQNMEQLIETFTPSWRNYRPWLFGEFCDSDTMRDLKQIRESKGVDKLMWEQGDPSKNPISRLKPDFRAHMHDKRMFEYGIRQDFDLICKLSINHSLVHRKMTLEITRSFAEICGYNITSIRDVPIATSGMFDDLMRPKFPIDEVRQFNSDIMLIPAWDLTRVWINGDRVMTKERFNFCSGDYYGLHVIVSNYSDDALINPILKWQLLCDGQVISSQTIETHRNFEVGEVRELGYISITLPEVEFPETFILSVEMTAGSKRATNQWPIFIYPTTEKINKAIGVYDTANIFTGIETLCDVVNLEDEEEVKGVDLVVTSRLTPKIRDYIEGGGKAFFIQRGEGFLPSKMVSFWREGMLRCYDHPIMRNIEYKTWMDDLRFYSLSTDTAFNTYEFERVGITNVMPIIRRYDCREWIATDYMVEIAMGKGKLIASTLRFEGGMGKQPLFIDNNKLGKWLLYSIVNYLVSNRVP